MFASSLLSPRSPWSTIIAKIPSMKPLLSPAPLRPLVFQLAVKTQSAILSGPPDTPKAKHQRNKFNKNLSLPVKWIFLSMLIMMENELGLKKLFSFF
jgi:hypothetical protein